MEIHLVRLVTGYMELQPGIGLTVLVITMIIPILLFLTWMETEDWISATTNTKWAVRLQGSPEDVVDLVGKTRETCFHPVGLLMELMEPAGNRGHLFAWTGEMEIHVAAEWDRGNFVLTSSPGMFRIVC